MNPEPLQIPMLLGRISIAVIALSHSLCATFIVGAALIGAVIMTIAYVTRRRDYARLAHMIAFILVLTTGTISFLGVAFVFALNILWPRFWHTLFQTMFWPFLSEAVLFLGEAVCAYAWYYLWLWSEKDDWRRKMHLAFAWVAAASALAAMFLIDLTASYMLTPSGRKGVWTNIFNPTMIDLDLHRWFGNLTWTGFALASLCAIGWLRARRSTEVSYYAWAATLCFSIGFGALLVMPVIGYQYLLHVRYGQPQAFETLMLGSRSWLFDVVVWLYSALVLIGSGFMWRRLRSMLPPGSFGHAFLPVSLFVLSGAAFILIQPYHIQHLPWASTVTTWTFNPLGKMQPYKYYALAFLVIFGLANWLCFIAALARQAFQAAMTLAHDRRAPSLLLALGVCAMGIMLVMGWTRETARAYNGYLVYGEIKIADETRTYTGPFADQMKPAR
ncbi:MAG: cytochrome ubiquinol oxidase subunit I [Nitrospirota bacterium]|nr:cytochrome ubiquinol oxidase subunit I [Nitrospirota bacterium]